MLRINKKSNTVAKYDVDRIKKRRETINRKKKARNNLAKRKLKSIYNGKDSINYSENIMGPFYDPYELHVCIWRHGTIPSKQNPRDKYFKILKENEDNTYTGKHCIICHKTNPVCNFSFGNDTLNKPTVNLKEAVDLFLLENKDEDIINNFSKLTVQEKNNFEIVKKEISDEDYFTVGFPCQFYVNGLEECMDGNIVKVLEDNKLVVEDIMGDEYTVSSFKTYMDNDLSGVGFKTKGKNVSFDLFIPGFPCVFKYGEKCMDGNVVKILEGNKLVVEDIMGKKYTVQNSKTVMNYDSYSHKNKIHKSILPNKKENTPVWFPPTCVDKIDDKNFWIQRWTNFMAWKSLVAYLKEYLPIKYGKMEAYTYNDVKFTNKEISMQYEKNIKKWKSFMVEFKDDLTENYGFNLNKGYTNYIDSARMRQCKRYTTFDKKNCKFLMSSNMKISINNTKRSYYKIIKDDEELIEEMGNLNISIKKRKTIMV